VGKRNQGVSLGMVDGVRMEYFVPSLIHDHVLEVVPVLRLSGAGEQGAGGAGELAKTNL
jgi:hypothetical protein